MARNTSLQAVSAHSEVSTFEPPSKNFFTVVRDQADNLPYSNIRPFNLNQPRQEYHGQSNKPDMRLYGAPFQVTLPPRVQGETKDEPDFNRQLQTFPHSFPNPPRQTTSSIKKAPNPYCTPTYRGPRFKLCALDKQLHDNPNAFGPKASLTHDN
ncbi:hypothetical protein PtB15_4B598 [Puccinia triticina]|nr:hypothetical protein PtB15_4B598 [Puccinia triticina]